MGWAERSSEGVKSCGGRTITPTPSANVTHSPNEAAPGLAVAVTEGTGLEVAASSLVADVQPATVNSSAVPTARTLPFKTLFTIHHPYFESSPATRAQSRTLGPIDRHFTAAVCNSESEVAEQERRQTDTHEVGYHFGIGDAWLHDLRW